MTAASLTSMQGQGRMSAMERVADILIVLAMLIQLFCFLAPLWQFQSVGNGMYGLWYFCLYGTCSHLFLGYMKAFEEGNAPRQVAVALLEVIGTVLMVTVFFCICYKKTVCRLRIAAVLSFLSGLCIMFSMILYGFTPPIESLRLRLHASFWASAAVVVLTITVSNLLLCQQYKLGHYTPKPDTRNLTAQEETEIGMEGKTD